MTPEPTNEERQAAVQLLRESGATSCESLTIFTLERLVALTRTEARNAALEAQVKEARELLVEAVCDPEISAHYFHEWVARRKAFLEATK